MVNRFFSVVKEIAAGIWYEKEKSCLLCGRADRAAVCPDCRQRYFLPNCPRCASCGKILGARPPDPREAARCLDCLQGKGPAFLNEVTSLGHYEGSWKVFIHKIKYQGQPFLLMELADMISLWAVQNLPPPDLLVPVPLHINRLAQRGYNQAEVLASILGGMLGIRVQDVLLRVQDTAPQTSFGRRERLENLKDAFALKSDAQIAGETVWLIDDVVTTGATLSQCASVLRQNGAAEVYGYCLGAGMEMVEQ